MGKGSEQSIPNGSSQVTSKSVGKHLNIIINKSGKIYNFLHPKLWAKVWVKGYSHTAGTELIQPFWHELCDAWFKMCIYFDMIIQLVGIWTKKTQWAQRYVYLHVHCSTVSNNRKTETVSVPNNRKLNFISIRLTVQLLELFVYLLKTINPIKTDEKTIPRVWPNFCFKKVKKSALCVHWKKARKVYQNIFEAVLCGEWNYRRTPTPPQPHLVIFLNFKEFLLWICIAAVNRKKKTNPTERTRVSVL